MELDMNGFIYLGRCLEGLFFGTISVNCQAEVAEVVQRFPIQGLYSGIFVIYLQHYGSQKSTDKTKNIPFYALWMLYALSAVTLVSDLLLFFIHTVRTPNFLNLC